MLGIFTSVVRIALKGINDMSIKRVEGEVSFFMTKNTVYVDFNDSYEKVLRHIKDCTFQGYVLPVMKDGKIVGGIDHSEDIGTYWAGDHNAVKGAWSWPCPYKFVHEHYDEYIPVMEMNTSVDEALALIRNNEKTSSQRGIITQNGELLGSVSLVNLPHGESGGTSPKQLFSERGY